MSKPVFGIELKTGKPVFGFGFGFPSAYRKKKKEEKYRQSVFYWLAENQKMFVLHSQY